MATIIVTMGEGSGVQELLVRIAALEQTPFPAGVDYRL